MTRVSINDSIAYHIHRTARLLRAHLLRRIRELGLDATPEQWFILSQLAQQDGQAQTELADDIFADRPNITRIVDGMERQGWVVRRSDPADGRRKLVFLTRLGREAAEKIAGMVRVERAVLFAGLDPKELAATRRLLFELERTLQQQMGETSPE